MTNHEIILSGVHMELTEALRNTVTHKMQKLFRHEERIIRIRVELEHDHGRVHEGEFMARAQIEIHGPPMVASAATDDLYKSIDELVEKLDRKLRRRARLSKAKRKHPHGVDLPACLPKVNVA